MTPALTIAFVTSGSDGGAAVAAGYATGEILSQSCGFGRRASRDVLPVADELIRRLGKSPADVRQVVVATGPGSFTGIRVGIATAMGIAAGRGASLGGIPTLRLMAEMVEPTVAGVVGVTLPAGRGEYYGGVFRRDEQGRMVSLEDVEARLLSASSCRSFLEGAAVIVTEAEPSAAFGGGVLQVVNWESCARQAVSMAPVLCGRDHLVPWYVRKSWAEEVREA